METNGGPAGAKPALAALFEEHRRLWRNLLSVPRVLDAAIRTQVGTSAHAVVLSEGTHRLLHYRRETQAVHAEPVLLCYALINRPYILDLQPDKSVVAQYLRRGFEVYMIDWGVPTDADRGRSVDHYVCGFLARAIDLIRARHAQAKAHLVGYCMGGTLAALRTAIDPEAVATLTLLAAPIDFSSGGSLLPLWTDPKVFDVDALLDAYGNCPAWFLQWCFLLTSPVRNFIDKAIALYEQMSDPRSVSSHFALERWLNDNIPVAGATFRQFVKQLYQQNQLVRGQFQVRGERIDLARITCPILLLTASNDHLVPPAATEGIRPHVRSGEVKSMAVGAGHVGLVVGGRAHQTLWPEATAWAAGHSTVATVATVATAEASPAPQAQFRAGAPGEARPATGRRSAPRPIADAHEPRWWAGNR